MVLKPDEPDESLLWERVAADEMPPKQSLSVDEKAVFKHGILDGARWGTGPIDPFRFTTHRRAGYDWWSLQPVARYAVPRVINVSFITSAAHAVPPAEALGLGPLTIHPTNPRYFARPDGRAVWLTGSHTWATLQERGVVGQTADFDYSRYLDFLRQHGHNFQRMWVWEHAQWMQFADADIG